jgi:hypothetical protein
VKLADALSDAARYFFLTGIRPGMHVCGARDARRWNCEVDGMLAPCVGHHGLEGAMRLLLMSADERHALWRTHRAALRAEARAHGFVEPAMELWATGRVPRDTPIAPAQTAAWRRAFLATQHGRHGGGTREGELDNHERTDEH